MLVDAPPTGTVTFVFTDIEGSTRLWEKAPDAMNRVMERHDELLDEVANQEDGYVFSRAGDGWGIAFSSSVQAVRAALAVEQRIANEHWPAPIETIKLRIGVHAGTANQRGGDFFGTTVNRAARVAAAAHGGQIFLTDAVHALIADELELDWRLHDMGEHRLRDLVRPEHIWLIGSAATAAPVYGLGPRTLEGNLPRQSARIIGRESLLEEILADVTGSSVVTLVGVGGVGKTTVAVEAARSLAADAGLAAWFVDLTTVDIPAAVAPWILASLGVAKRPDMDDLDSLIDGLATGEWIIVIDNAEHLIDQVARIVDRIAARVQSVKFIVTSREPLAIDAEIVRRVPTLISHGQGDGSAAALLFLERAMEAAPDLSPAAFPAEVVSEICNRLDGLPLAIELAAAHAETMTPVEILAALDAGRLELRSGLRSVAARHRSLDDLVGWSYDRLDLAAKRVFERLSIFVGGAEAAAAEAVCADDELDQRSVQACLHALVRKSLVTPDRSTGNTRFTMLDLVYQYAQQQRVEEPANAAAEARHAAWFADFSRQAYAGMQTPAEAQWLSRILREADNLERAARWAARNDAADVLGALGTCLPALLESNDLPGIDGLIELALEALAPDDPARIDYAYAAAYISLFGGDIHGWREVFNDATAAVRDHPRANAVREGFGLVSSFFLGDMDVVKKGSPKMLAAARQSGDLRMAGSVAVDLGLAHLFMGETEQAWKVADDFHRRAVADGIPSMLAWSYYLLGELESGANPAIAIDHFEESVENAVAVGSDFVAGLSLTALAASAGRSGDTSVGLDAIYRAIRLWYGAGNRPQFWTAIRNLVEILHRLDRNEDAFRLHVATEAASETAPELFGHYGDLYRQVAAQVELSLPETDGMTPPRVDLDYAGTANFAIGLLEQLIDSA